MGGWKKGGDGVVGGEGVWVEMVMEGRWGYGGSGGKWWVRERQEGG